MSVSSVTSSSSTSSSTSSAMSTLTESSDAFLTLLITQLQVQDPTNPVDTTTFVSQLTTLASLEQDIENGEKLDTISSQLSIIGMGSAALSYLGKTVEAEGDTTDLQDGSATWEYDLDDEAASVKLTVTDSDGNTVYSTTGDTDEGTHTFTWDGTDSSGTTYTSGSYTLAITALDSDGNEIDTTTRIRGTVTSVDNSDGTIMLGIGDTQIEAEDVVSMN